MAMKRLLKSLLVLFVFTSAVIACVVLPVIMAYVRSDSQLMFDTAEAIPYVKVTYGAAAGHFGIMVGPTNLPTPASWPHVARYTTWAPGVWFFDGQ